MQDTPISLAPAPLYCPVSDLKITRTVFTSLVAHFMLSFLSFLTFFWVREVGTGARVVAEVEG